uniref:Rho GDP dissociation inhibitor gamma n=4 Tax=Passeriformes TaxID=9126 RepID=A0A803W448_FICAL
MSEHRPGPGGTGASHGGDPRCPPATSQPVAPGACHPALPPAGSRRVPRRVHPWAGSAPCCRDSRGARPWWATQRGSRATAVCPHCPGDPHLGPCGPGAECRQCPLPHAVFPACPQGWSSGGFGELSACSHKSGRVIQWVGRVRDCGDITHPCVPQQFDSTRATGATIPAMPFCPAAADDIMADKEGVTLSLEEEEEDADVALAYKTPEKKSLQEIQELDPGDESLRKYKQALLGAIPAAVDASVPNVQVTKLTLMCEQAPGPITMDLTGDLEELRGRAFVLKEGVDYRVKVSFKVNREIVCGLRCLHLTYRRGRPVDRDVFMVGSYAPRAEEYEVVTPAEEAPRGWLARGSYRVRSLVTDDDKSEHLSWEWGLCIKKAWED